MAYKVFANGFPLQASELNNNLMQQSIAVFVDATSRDAAITVPVEGQFAYLTASDALVKYDGTSWLSALPSGATASEQSSSRTITSADSNSFIYATGTITITVSDVLAIGQSINFIQNTAGAITFAVAEGVTLNSKQALLATNGQFTGVTLTKKAANQYYLIGDLA